ncbi:poly-beta-1,6-N-acetyl-D-glucosamine biosynthesis protein PgaD [Methylomonas paludis]|uniref:Poly-beta-1,6-N-acetyl-D-glucosamine biosynthesis protein PgaD n=1 Tax=Methylomonas paludis TaxID=1173101 RepID=A0A975MP86_9GAMM|nr:poly-beta-1,6-N-acetyl-D-glucosamine biosynthesis protein PgaD [Methylomonas paludis]QWF71410.1 poly-beta-1,6-N-acetyl-D-glucosamine biosynthesis protein PgaD [Methylomonas paludis]
MKDIIINQPHLQSFRQKCGSIFLSICSWLLWLYFLLPLFTLGGWLLGVKNLSDEIRWFGGYKTLLELLEMYGEIILVIALLWLLWSFCLSWLHDSIQPKRVNQVSDQQLCLAFHVNESCLQVVRAAQKVTVYFDDTAGITSIQTD